MNNSGNWYDVDNIEGIDSPALLIYPDRVASNISKMIEITGGVHRLRPHVKTYKMAEIVRMQMAVGINQFKCATISEAEMLGMVEVPDVLLAYQPTGPKIDRLLKLVEVYPKTIFSALIDNTQTAKDISDKCLEKNTVLNVFIDLDTGNHRTGIAPNLTLSLYEGCSKLTGIKIIGLHAYDGHLRNSDFNERKIHCDEAFLPVEELRKQIITLYRDELEIIAGGTPTFNCHAVRKEYVICSPGTCILWDWGYLQKFPDYDFSLAALVISRIISKVGSDRITLDLGHKAIGSENPFPRVHFLNMAEGEQVGHSEEHLVIKIEDNSIYNVGDLFYGAPYHICPTVTLYSEAEIVNNGKVTDKWKVIARDRVIGV
ncbi:MAG: D-TA family PLP-dependent enzyme [Bacteroidetes bacterium]|nr:D-TA family PLP-dependent enzyme [Bacteroidota bacterium]MDA1119962.1 D-TA family PLP-dependent enzyme [Bacteroidota bacterium]